MTPSGRGRALPSLPDAPRASSLAVRAVMRANRKRDTRPEIALRSVLHKRGARYKVDTKPDPNLRCRADVVFSRARVAVFIDGCFWHDCPTHGTHPTTNAKYWHAKIERNVARDRRNDVDLLALGWSVVRVWEHESPCEAADRVLRVVHQRLQAAE
jgi:DNA mismatch endonuclease (patch repair protein)